MPKPIQLNVADVALAAKRAYDRKRLSAQGPTPECRYRDASGRPCAIGAALSARVARRFNKRPNDAVTGLVDDDLMRTDDLYALRALQNAHDEWADRRGSEQAFLAVLLPLLPVEG